jgi:tetratricopeptide (TPR) repeat protein
MQKNAQQRLIECRTAVDRARAADDPQRLCLALIDLGAAQFQTRQYERGRSTLDEAGALAATLDDRRFQAYCLSLKAETYQDIGRFHDAYEILEEIVALADEADDLGIKCDAVLTQGQVLINSGEPMLALDKLNEARSIASSLDDKRYAVKVFGALGNLKLAVAALDDAQSFFAMASLGAAQLGDERAECGYLLNQGTVMAWQKQYAQAVPVLERALSLAETLKDSVSELVALRYLTESLHNLEQPARVIPLAQRGITLSRAAQDHPTTFSFFQTCALAHYRTGQPDEALCVIQAAIDHAEAVDDQEQETNMLLNLGESCMVMELYQQALTAYQRALVGLQDSQRLADEAHVQGRIGVVLAELGQIEQAITYHRQAAEAAHQRGLPELEAEQMIMLALAYLDQQHHDQARSCCQTSISVYSAIGLEDDANRARQVLAAIPSPQV